MPAILLMGYGARHDGSMCAQREGDVIRDEDWQHTPLKGRCTRSPKRYGQEKKVILVDFEAFSCLPLDETREEVCVDTTTVNANLP